jgi:hypothetical protein
LSNQALNNPQKSGIISHAEENVAISETSLLVPLAKSKKLAAIRNRSQALQTIKTNALQRSEIPSSGRNKEVSGLLTEARDQIDTKIAEIMARYPPGKKNKMFALKYGSPESIKKMAMKAIFTHLNMVKLNKFALIESLDYFDANIQ